MSVFLWGPPGTGKTTISAVVSRQSDSRFVELSAVTAGVNEDRGVLRQHRQELCDARATEVQAVLDEAPRALRTARQTVLFIAEVHRVSKTHQDLPLPAVDTTLA